MATSNNYTFKPNCPSCGSFENSVTYSPGPHDGRKYRRRTCKDCGHVFTTRQQLTPLGLEQPIERFKGRGPLDAETVREIRNELAKGKYHQTIADLYEINRTTVTYIKSGKSYGYVS